MKILITIFLCGDIMTGRGIDQVLPYPIEPAIYESYVRDAGVYVELAERKNGRIPKPVEFEYIWGDALKELDRIAPDARVINLETSVTASADHWKGKGIHYRMHPKNVRCLTAAKIDICVLANNHVLDWGYSGLQETLKTLSKENMRTAGAGPNEREARVPAILEIEGKGRVVVFAFGEVGSGIPPGWKATADRPGVNLLTNLSRETVKRIARMVRAVEQEGDVVIASIHWGGNWGYGVPRKQQEFAHQLIDDAGVDIIHGHSSHHVKALEVYQNKLIIYGCGDFLNDYEGIGGYERFRNDLTLMYFPSVNPSSGELVRLRMIPMRIRRFRLRKASSAEAEWLRDVLNREGLQLGTRVKLQKDKSLEVVGPNP